MKDTEKLWEIAEKIGTKRDNFDYAMKVDPEGTTESLLDTAKFMGWK